MPTAPVDNNGTVLSFEDTGIPRGTSTYLTVILVHGILFHGAIFQNLAPYAASNNLRLVCVNMRDYPGSTSFSLQELDALKSGDPEQQASALRVQAQQLATFIQHFATTYNIPEIAQVEKETVGGLALLTWSMSNCLTISMLASAESLPRETREVLSKYLRSTVLLEPVAATTCGVMPAENWYHPFRDASRSFDERVAFSQVWFGYYFSKVRDLDSVTPEILNARTPLHESSQELPVDYSKTPTTVRMSKEERESIMDRDALVRSSLPILRITPEVFQRNFERALFNTDGVLPNVKVVFAWGNESQGDCIYAAKLTSDRLKVAQSEETVVRDIDFQRLEGCNHIPHWDHPEKIIRLLTSRA